MPQSSSFVPDVPPWALAWLQSEASPNGEPRNAPWQHTGDGWWSRHFEGSGLQLRSYRLTGAVLLDAEGFQKACRDAYRRLIEDLSQRGASQPVRLWNFIPGILEPLGGLEHRYMVFNAGRYQALQEWMGEHQLASKVATASGVGHFGNDFVLHCLAAETPGRPVENPRQIPAYRYSKRFGPLPPCFARATEWRRCSQTPPWLFVGGTASVRGEDSFHDADLRRQLDETLYNLAAVVRSASGEDCPHLTPEDVRSLLVHYADLRIYLVDPELREPVEERLEGLLAPETAVEFVHVDLCRPELLVEIEGLAGPRPQTLADSRPIRHGGR